MNGRLAGKPDLEFSVSGACNSWRYFACGSGASIFCAGNDSYIHSNVRDSQRVHRREGEGYHRRHGRWVRRWIGGAVRRPNFRRIHESRAVFGSGIGVISFSRAVDLPDRSGPGRAFRGTLLPVRARRGLLCAAEGVGEIFL